MHLDNSKNKVFLDVSIGDIVLISEIESTSKQNLCFGLVLFSVGGSSNSKVNTIFQVQDIDTGLIFYVNADQVIDILKKG